MHCKFHFTLHALAMLMVNPLYTELHFLVWFTLPLVHELALETWAKGFTIKPVWVYDLCHTHSLASLQWPGLSDQWTLLPTEPVYSVRKGAPAKPTEEPFYSCLCQKERHGTASADQGISTATQDSCYVHSMSWQCRRTSLYPSFFASTKPIFKMNFSNW